MSLDAREHGRPSDSPEDDNAMDGLESVCENSISEPSPEGTAELSPGR